MPLFNALATTGPGSGSVTSVGLSVPAPFDVSGSPVTGAGTLSLEYSNELPNTVLAGPTTAPNAAPAMRALVAADLPATAALTDAANIFAQTETFTPASTAGVPLVVKGLASQTGNLQQWQNSSGTVLNRIDKGGYGNPPGITLYGLANPSGLATATGSASPGTNLSASTTYYYLLTGVDYGGKETPATVVVSYAEGGTARKVDLSWTSYTPANAQYINIYKGTSSTVSALRLLAQVASSTTTYTDDGSLATSGQAPPASPTLIGGFVAQGVSSVFNSQAVALANFGLVNIGAGAFDGATSGFFSGSSSGTQLAINAPSGFAGTLIEAQVAGVSKFTLSAAGAITNATLGAGSLTGSHTLPDGTLSTNVPLLNAANTFTAAQTVSATVAGVLAQINNASTTGAGILVGSTAIASAGGGLRAPALALTQAPVATTFYGALSVGPGPWDGSTGGKYAGAAGGTLIAVNAGDGSANLIDLQQGGISYFQVGPFGRTLIVASSTQSSGTQIGHRVTANHTGSSAAGYSMMVVNAVENSTGSGTKLLLDLQKGGTSQFSVDRVGNIALVGTTASSATAGSNGAVPSQVATYLTITVGGTAYKLPLFNT